MIIIFLLLMIPSLLHPMHHEEAFLRANKLYRERRYADAHTLYEMIEPKTAALWHNSGNCLYHEKKLYEALYAWRCAFKGSCWSDKALIQKQIKDLVSQLGRADQQGMYQLSLFDRVVHVVPFVIWQLLFLCLWFMLLILLKRFLRTKQRYAFLGTLVILLLIAYLFYCGMQAQRPRIFVTNDAKIYVGPDTHYHQQAQLARGDELVVIEFKPGWALVTTNQTKGWISDDHYKPL